jgi:Tol biopolymer transport system component
MMKDTLLQILVVLLLLTLSGCQAMRPAAAGPTRTPILLGTQAARTAARTAAPTRPAATATPAATPELPAAPATSALPAAAPAQDTPELTATPLARIMALGTRPTIVLRSLPAAGARAAAQLAGSAVLWAEGRSADGRWLWVSYGEQGAAAWVASADVNVLGDVKSLPVIDKQAALPPAASLPTGRGETAAAPARTPARPPAASTSRPAATRPSAPRAMGKLAFQTASGGDIYIVNADGTGLHRVTDGIDPALSPDGAQLAFTRWNSAPHGVFVLDLATGQERRVASADRPRSPAWSRDGSQIAFTHVVRTISCRATPFGCIDEGQLRAQFRGQDCIQSPVGKLCISDFPVQEIEETGIAQVSPDGQNWLDLGALGDAQSLSWNPRQDELLYRGGAGLQITAPNQDTREVLRDPAISGPAWSPDGQRIVVQKHLHDNADIFLLDAAGKEVARLTAPASDVGRAANNVAPAWSPDGRSILFLSDRDGAWRLYRMNPDGSGQALFLPDVLGSLALKYDFAAERVVSWSK